MLKKAVSPEVSALTKSPKSCTSSAIGRLLSRVTMGAYRNAMLSAKVITHTAALYKSSL